MQAVSDASIFFSVQKYKASDYFSYFVLLHSNTYLLSVTDFTLRHRDIFSLLFNVD